MPDAISAPLPAGLSAAPDLLHDLLEVSLTGVIVFRPLYAPHDPATIIDLAYVRLNPAARRMLQLPERPAESFLTRYPSAADTGIFAFYRDTFLSGQSGRYDVNYQHDGLDNFFRLAGRRSGELLVVSFTDTADQDRSAVEKALRDSQAAEKAAYAEANRQRQQLYSVFEQAPAMICIFDGPEHVFQFVNPPYQALVGNRPLVGRPIAEAMPELAGQPIFGLLDQVYQTGKTFHASEMLVQLDHANAGAQELEKRFYNFIYQARHDLAGAINGILVFAYEVTPQVLARQQLEQLNEKLEACVAERTQELEAALRETEQQREQLRGQQSQLQQIMGQVPAFIAQLEGPEHRHGFFNAGYYVWSGNRAKVGLTIAEVYPEVIPQGFIGLLDEVYRTGIPFIGTEMLAELYDEATGQPEERYVDFIYQPLTGAQGQTTGILAFIVNVTEKVLARRQNEALQAEVLAAARQQAQERETFYQVFAHTPAAICIQRGPEHRYEYLNAAYQQFFPDRQLLGRPVAEVLPETVEAGIVALLDNVYQTGETYFGHEVPLLVDQAEGPPRQMYFTFTYQAYRESGEIVGISTFAYEVSEQVRAGREREAQQRQLYALFTSVPAPIVILDGPDFVFQLINPASQHIFPGQGLLNKPLLTVFPELTDTPVPAILNGVYHTGETFTIQELPVLMARHEHGPLEQIYFTATYQARRDEQGTVDGVIVFAYEITEQVQARERVQDLNEELAVMNEELAAVNEEMQATNEELNESNHQLTRTNVDLDNFIYTASHDLKAPISNIEGLLHVLTQQLPPDVSQTELVQPILDMMQGAVDRFKQTIDHLTDVSKLQQEHAPTTEQVDLAAVVESVRPDLLPLLTDTNADLEINVADCPALAFSVKNLRSVVYNLLSNALKYRHPTRRPEVRISCQQEAGWLVLRVQDNGLGLDEAQQTKLFGMFQRLHTHVEGSGIGLYMVKKMVENAGGKIAVASQPGVGSTFTVSFPA